MRARHLLSGLAGATLLGWACSGDVTGAGPGQGVIEVRLTDHPAWMDSIAEVNVFVVRVDARLAEADSAECALDDDDDRDSVALGNSGPGGGDDREGPDDPDEDRENRWVTIASPNATFNLLDLQNGVTALLGAAVVDTGDFKALRIVIDPSQSEIVLRNGTRLTGASSPFAEFGPGELLAIQVQLTDEGFRVKHRGHSVLVIDFDLEDSFSMRDQAMRDGLRFTPVLRATVN
ncbi:MAG TPA: DUF4382 domain-containing protein [Gemmatimonadaceae bacterium]|nr:DUF4382 domain-containing protein [Gemmatimonadaceae bacterium]